MNNLPKEFQERMQRMLGEEYGAFLASYGEPRRPGLRVNMLKRGKGDTAEISAVLSLFGAEPIPWAPTGYYYDPQTRPGKHPFHEAGVYYMQEPSAMAVAALSGVKPGMRVLDLCAAPGGKSTQLASMLRGEGVLYSNEIHPARAKILSQNIERMGITNAIVMNEEPARLAARFPLYFDTVVVDAPCSGEGMFRKEEEAIPNWSPENVELCARRQQQILDCAAEMTAAGGTLVYSTCTFAPQENEQNAGLFLMRHPDFEIADLPAELGAEFMERTGLSAGSAEFAKGIGIPEEIREPLRGSIRLWPHKLEGEGHFLAVFRKSGSGIRRRGGTCRALGDREVLRLWKEFCKETLTETGTAALQTDASDAALILFGKELYRIPEAVGLDGLKVVRPGLHLGTVKKNRFEPSHSLAAALGTDDVRCSVEISDPDEEVKGDGRAASAYLRGESLWTQDCSSVRGNKGWCLMTNCGYSCGWGKLSGGQIKNHYPKGVRRPY